MKTVINIKADQTVKEEARKLAGEIGIPLSTIINAYLKQFIKTREVYFSSMPRMTPKLEELVGTAQEDFKLGKNITGPFANSAEMDAHLDAL